MKVLIVVPRYSSHWGEFYQIPLGLGYIASAIRTAGHDVVSVNLNHQKGSVAELVRQAVQTHQPDICASGGLSPFLPNLQAIFTAARKVKPNIINIAGGGIVSGEAEMSIQVMDVDYGVVGEGENTTVALLECIESKGDPKEVQGIVFKTQGGKCIETPARPQSKNLEAFAWPDFELLEMDVNLDNQRPHDAYFFHAQPDSNPRGIDMITSRSCPFSCTFCFHPIGKVYRERSLDDFFDELDSVVANFDVNMVAIVDELFSLKRRRLLEFCERIEPYGLLWMVQLHVNSVDEETISAMRRAGCAYISYGIESMSQPVLISMEKKSKTERIQSALELTQKNKIGIQGNLLFGDKAETLDTANESMHWWSKNRTFQINLTPLIVFPGSPDYYDALKDGMIGDRDKFVRDIPPDFNISRMNNEDMAMVRFFIYVFSNTLLNIAKVKSFKPSAEQIPDRDVAYDIEWGCPGCGHENEYLQTVMPAGTGLTTRLTCRSCLTRWDIENRAHFDAVEYANTSSVRRRQRLAEFSQLAGIAITRLREGRVREVAKKTIKRLFLNSKSPDVATQEPVVNVPLKQRVIDAGNSLATQPYNAQLHLNFAEVLLEADAYGSARLHFEQVLLYLDPDNQRAKDGIEYIDKSEDVTDEQRQKYFVSWSDAPPPARLSDKIKTENNPEKVGA